MSAPVSCGCQRQTNEGAWVRAHDTIRFCPLHAAAPALLAALENLLSCNVWVGPVPDDGDLARLRFARAARRQARGEGVQEVRLITGVAMSERKPALPVGHERCPGCVNCGRGTSDR